MIADSGKYFLYRHIRLDKNEPFYIGIGTKRNYSSFKSIYARAFEKESGRNKHWKNIINKTNYKIEILLESDNYEFIKEKEIEFIKLYQFLVNKTTGGEGFSSNHTEESRNKMKISKKLKKDEKKKEIQENVINRYLKGEIIINIAKQNNVCKDVVRDILKEAKIIKNSSKYKKRTFYIFNTLKKSINKVEANYYEIVKLTKISEPLIRKMMFTNRKIKQNNFYVIPNLIDIKEIEEEYNNRLIKNNDKN